MADGHRSAPRSGDEPGGLTGALSLAGGLTGALSLAASAPRSGDEPHPGTDHACGDLVRPAPRG